MARIEDFFSWAVDEAGLRSYLGVATGETAELQLWYEAAIDIAERRVNRDFNDGADPPVSEDPPRSARVALYEGVKAMREAFKRNFGVLSKTTDKLTESFGEPASFAAMHAAMTPFLVQLRLNVHLEGG